MQFNENDILTTYYIGNDDGLGGESCYDSYCLRAWVRYIIELSMICLIVYESWRMVQKFISAVTRIRTGVLAATTQSPNH